jgi:hypothetical protein
MIALQQFPTSDSAHAVAGALSMRASTWAVQQSSSAFVKFAFAGKLSESTTAAGYAHAASGGPERSARSSLPPDRSREKSVFPPQPINATDESVPKASFAAARSASRLIFESMTGLLQFRAVHHRNGNHQRMPFTIADGIESTIRIL